MWTYDLQKFETATIYFKEKLQSEQGKKFLQRNFGIIVDAFTGIINNIFDEGINYELEKDSYQLIFNPLEEFCQNDFLINSLD